MTKHKNIVFTLITAALITVVLSFVFPKNKEKYLADMFWTRKTFSSSNKNVVLMGDSRVYRGLSPDAMQNILPHFKLYNFAYSNGGLNAEMFLAAEQKLTKTDDAKVIVLGITANTLTDFTNNNTQYVQELNRPREEILERLYLNPVSYWFSATTPEQLISWFSAKKDTSENYYLSNYKMNGYVESDKFPIDTTEAIASYTKDFSNYQVDDAHLKGLFSQVKTWTEKGITVLAFRPPVSEPMVELENKMGLYDESKISEGIRNAGGYWIHLDNSQYLTYDGSHVDRPSAEKLSQQIALKIKELTGN
ncbi:hypothetical protein [uncultured Draconibacterium sp.]|uniref:hypothetical protein n=1 Tax=uncultured Draconibacterium sp. TaxID=1573823 RepID=UPI00321635D6